MTQDTFTLTREIDAPRDLVWKAYTEAEHLEKWWGPKGVTIRVGRLDFRPGGEFLYGMELPGGKVMWGKWAIREVHAPERMVTVVSFCDEQGNPQRHPMSPTWPIEMLSDATFREKDGVTTLHLEVSALHATTEEETTFLEGRESMRAGFGATWSQLEEYLKPLQS